jgi:hypothetical protein
MVFNNQAIRKNGISGHIRAHQLAFAEDGEKQLQVVCAVLLADGHVLAQGHHGRGAEDRVVALGPNDALDQRLERAQEIAPCTATSWLLRTKCLGTCYELIREKYFPFHGLNNKLPSYIIY